MQRSTLIPLLLVITHLTGCGVFVEPDHHNTDTNPQPAEPVSPPAPIGGTPPVSTPSDAPKTFEGFVGGAFAVTVDGTSYSDMEDFYTKEQARLPAKVQAAGYDASWTARFDAQVGLADLWRNMTVYISPEANQGYQGTTSVEDSGKFAITLPEIAVGHDYKVRANKRIGIVLTRAGSTVDICYNFSAVERSVPFKDDSLPIVLDTFVSQVTTYACDLGTGTGLTVPAAPDQPQSLAVGETKSDAARILGLNGLFASSPTQWCWAFRTTADSPCAAKKADSSCDCSVTFDPAGKITALDGIAATYLKAPTGT